MYAMVFAAGMGTRLKPLTDVIPKALVPVAGKPLLQHVLDRLCEAGAQKVVVNVHHHAAQVRNFLQLAQRAYPCELVVSDESQCLLETGGGIRKARGLFANACGPVLIHNVDILSNVDLAAFYEQSVGHDATLLVSDRVTQRYLLFDSDMRLVGWTNVSTGEVRSPYPDIKAMDGDRNAVMEHFAMGGIGNGHGSMYAFSGIHTFASSLFPLMDMWPERFPVMDFYLRHCAEADIRGIVKPDLKLLDVGKIDTLAKAEDFLTNNE